MRTRLIALAVSIVLAIVGAVTLVTYVRGVQSSAAAGAESREVLVVDSAIAAGTPASRIADAVSTRSIPAAYVPEGAVTDLAQLAGKVATTDLVPGEQLLAARFSTPDQLTAAGATVPAPEGLQEVSLSVDSARVAAGRVGAGSRLGVWVSGGSGSKGSTTLLFDQVLVTAADAPQGGGTVTLTLALSADDTRELINAAEFESLWFSLQPDDGGAS